MRIDRCLCHADVETALLPAVQDKQLEGESVPIITRAGHHPESRPTGHRPGIYRLPENATSADPAGFRQNRLDNARAWDRV